MKKIIAALLILVCFMCLFACTDKEEANNTTNQALKPADTENVNLAEIKESIIADCAVEGAMDIDAYMLLNLYGIEEADVKENASFTTMDGVFPDEIIMIKASSEDAVERIIAKLENRLEAVLEQSKNYDAENFAIAQKCKVLTKGDVVALFVSAQHEQMQEIFLSAF
ncbi:MAG: DUF4358 domain-containing protein [Ruminococcus sp.]|nr:DUF4358 domain-containing protein [Ruminococcus sp.]